MFELRLLEGSGSVDIELDCNLTQLEVILLLIPMRCLAFRLRLPGGRASSLFYWHLLLLVGTPLYNPAELDLGATNYSTKTVDRTTERL